MRHVRLWADTHSTGLIDARGASIRRESTTLSDETWHALRRWVADYDHVIPLDAADRVRIRAEIDDLDARGLALLAAVRAEWPADRGEPITFSYFSEGRLITLPEP
jgi:hypothetical protein